MVVRTAGTGLSGGGGGGSAFTPQNWDAIEFDDVSTELVGCYNLGGLTSADSGGTIANLVTGANAIGDITSPAFGLQDVNFPLNNGLPENAGGSGFMKLTNSTFQVSSGDHDISTQSFCIIGFFKLRGGVQTGASNHGFYLNTSTQLRVSTFNAGGNFRLMVGGDTNEGDLANWDLSTIFMLAVGRRDDNSTYSYLNGNYNGGRLSNSQNFISDDISLMGGDPNSILIEFAIIDGDVSQDDLDNIFNNGNYTFFNAE